MRGRVTGEGEWVGRRESWREDGEGMREWRRMEGRGSEGEKREDTEEGGREREEGRDGNTTHKVPRSMRQEGGGGGGGGGGRGGWLQYREITRDSKNKYFFQRSWIIMVEISRSRIIRITNYSARTLIRMCMYARKSVCTAPHTHTRVYRCNGDGYSHDLYRERRRRCGAGDRERKDSIVNRVGFCSTACRTSSVTSAIDIIHGTCIISMPRPRSKVRPFVYMKTVNSAL